MNDSFESPSHLERRIQAGLADASDSSLSAPGFGRRAKSESLSFQTDEGSDDGRMTQVSYNPSTHRMLDDLSTFDSGRTPTSRRRTGGPSLANALASSKEANTQQQQRQSTNQPWAAHHDEQEEDSLADLSASQTQIRAADHSVDLSKSATAFDDQPTTSTHIQQQEDDRRQAPAPVNSTPHRANASQRSQTLSFYSQRSGATTAAEPTGKMSLARRAAEMAARETTKSGRQEFGQSGNSVVSTGAMSSAVKNGATEPSQHSLSVNTIEEARSPDQSQDDASNQRQDEVDESRQSVDDSVMRTREIQPRGAPRDDTMASSVASSSRSPARRSRTTPASERNSIASSSRIADVRTSPSRRARSSTVRSADDSVPAATSPAAARAARQTTQPTPSPAAASFRVRQSIMATPKPKVGADRMQSYLLSAIKDPMRNQQIQRSVKAQRIKAQRVPIDQIQSESSSPSSQQQSTATSPMPAMTPYGRMDRLGRPMTIGAGRTPLPFKPSGLANQVAASETSSVSDRSSTYDLMTPARGWDRMSEPGAPEGNVPSTVNRVDPQKLARQVSKMNEVLSDENHSLKEEVESMRRQLNIALREKENLAKQVGRREGAQSPSSIPLPPSPIPGADGDEELEDAYEKIAELERHKEELNDMLDDLEERYEELERENQDLADGKDTGKQDEEGNQTSKTELRAELKEVLSELADVDEALQQSEAERERLQGAFDEAKEFAMEEVSKSEDARDQAVKESEKLRRQIDTLETTVKTLREERKQSNADQPDLEDLREQIDQLQDQLAQARDDLEQADMEHQQEREELEAALQERDADLAAMEEDRAALDEQLKEADRLKDELDRQTIAVTEKENEILTLNRQMQSSHADGDKVSELESALATSRRDLASAQAKVSGMLSQSEHQKQLQIKTDEIAELTRQRKELAGRLEDYKQQASSLSYSFNAKDAAPGSVSSAGLKTPAAKGVHKTLLNLQTPIRTPRSPGGMLSPASWLNEATIGNESVVLHVQELQRLLDEANAKIDEKLAEMDKQGMSHLTLTKRLLEAHHRIEELEGELNALMASKDQDWHDLAQKIKEIKCTACRKTFDASKQIKMVQTSSSKSSKAFAKSVRSTERDAALAQLIDRMPVLTARLAEMGEENRALKDAGQRLNSEVGKATRGKDVKETARNLQKATQSEVQRARAAIVDLDSELRAERRRLPDLARESQVFGDLSSAAERDLARTEYRLRAIETELRRKVSEHDRLQRDLMEQSSSAGLNNGELPVQLQVLQAQIRQTTMEVEHLREDKKAVLETRTELHNQFRMASGKYQSIQAELATTRQTVEAHQTQLQSQTAKIEELHRKLQSQHQDVRRLTGDRDRLHAQREGILKDVSTLESDLQRVRLESLHFGQDLERLRKERDEQTRRAQEARETSLSITNEAQETIEGLKRKLECARKMIREVELQDLRGNPDTTALKEKHMAECKGLIVHIRYLKTKFMRESDLREDLCFQKRYLLQILGGMDKSEGETLKFLADLEQSRLAGTRRNRTAPGRSSGGSKFRKVAFAVLATSKMMLMARRWQETKQVKKALVGAHAAAKKRRMLEGGEALPKQIGSDDSIGDETVKPIRMW